VAGELEVEAKGECVRALVAVLRPLVAQIATLTGAVEHAVEAHSDGNVVRPLFRSGRICAAQILAELGDDRGRFVSADQLAAEGGVAPSREPGKHRAVVPLRVQQRLRTASRPWPTARHDAVGAPSTSALRSRLRARARAPHPRPRLVPRDLDLLAKRRLHWRTTALLRFHLRTVDRRRLMRKG
jgi:hypothetical protein